MPAISTHHLVSEENLRSAVALFHGAGGRGTTRAAMQKALGVSYKTQDRIFSIMKEQGAAFETRREKGVLVYVMSRPPRWDRRISAPARLALHLAGLALTATGTSRWTELLNGLEQLADESMTTEDRRLFEALSRAATLPGEDTDIIESENVLEPILKAIREQRVATVAYRAAGFTEATDFELVPYRLVHDLFAGGAFLLAWNQARQQPEHFRLNRIDSVRPGRPAGLPDSVREKLDRAAAHQVGGWTSGGAPFEVVVRISGRHWVQSLFEAPPALPFVQVERLGSGQAVNVRFRADHPAGVERWILQFGSKAKVISPDWLRESIEKEWRRAIGL